MCSSGKKLRFHQMASEGKYLCLSMESSSDSPFPVVAWGWLRPQGKWATQRVYAWARWCGAGVGSTSTGTCACLKFCDLWGPLLLKGCYSGISGSLGLGACKLAPCPHLISSFHEDVFRPGFSLFLFLRRLWLIWPNFSLGRPKGNQTFTRMFWSCWSTSATSFAKAGPYGGQAQLSPGWGVDWVLLTLWEIKRHIGLWWMK